MVFQRAVGHLKMWDVTLDQITSSGLSQWNIKMLRGHVNFYFQIAYPHSVVLPHEMSHCSYWTDCYIFLFVFPLNTSFHTMWEGPCVQDTSRVSTLNCVNYSMLHSLPVEWIIDHSQCCVQVFHNNKNDAWLELLVVFCFWVYHWRM